MKSIKVMVLSARISDDLYRLIPDHLLNDHLLLEALEKVESQLIYDEDGNDINSIKAYVEELEEKERKLINLECDYNDIKADYNNIKAYVEELEEKERELINLKSDCELYDDGIQLAKDYDKYFDQCEAAQKIPLPFSEWLKINHSESSTNNNKGV
jgi:tetrahydromethanopterin S-methyltransferase subunit F